MGWLVFGAGVWICGRRPTPDPSLPGRGEVLGLALSPRGRGKEEPWATGGEGIFLGERALTLPRFARAPPSPLKGEGFSLQEDIHEIVRVEIRAR